MSTVLLNSLKEGSDMPHAKSVAFSAASYDVTFSAASYDVRVTVQKQTSVVLTNANNWFWCPATSAPQLLLD